MKRMLLLGAAAMLGVVCANNADATLVGGYDFSGGSLNDISGNGNHAAVSEGAFPGSGATFTNGAVVDGTRGDVFDLTGGGVGGDGSNGGLNVNLPVAGNNTGSWTVALWVNESSAAGAAYLFDNRNTATGAPAGGDRLILTLGQGSPSGGPTVWNGTSFADTGTAAINDGQWHHVAWVYNAGTLTAYVDGVAGNGGVAHTIADILLEDIEIGNEGTGGGQGGQTDRLVDDIAVYNHALSSNEISTLMTNGVPEPASLALLGLGGLMMLRRRRDA